ncbi:sulfatase-like hydrolase/transferase [Paracoccus sp. MC1862]|uniref:sulfatase-like hydrolase/transferase n=1 Tax=Paracoccus sp. MC1862 TaxID=2760307 RepID=UPI001601DCF1|nr:sulfatase-like hydrolase/transferase [Paracoccus sp. MC1862]MBB1499373.1 sulfatase-like hydrolase/transferase [Paracoccus sp. MC1862]QQO44638.1 sulfatase-like hydrolase/transferase [Paracoccus sp. MC1862]
MAFTRDSIEGDNICLIWVDDMIDVFTWRDAFGVTIRTPNIDRLLNAGVHFSNTYASVPLCAPCRAEVATGISPYRSGLVDLNRVWRDVMPPERAWAYDLRRAGFYNFTTGKTDAHYKPMPEDYRRILFHEDPEASDKGGRRNVKDYLGGKGPGVSGVNHPDDDGSQDDRFYDYWVAQNAIDHLQRADPGRRHLIQLGFKHPHFNLECPDRFYQMYDPAEITWPAVAAPEDFHGPQPGMAVYELAYIVNGSWTPEKAGDEGWRQVVRAYFAACSHVDHEIGRFLDALAASALGDRTTVVFLSDNGFNLGNHDSFHKMSQWDSAAHVPLGIWSPRMEAGRVVDLPISLHNLPMTIMDLAGLPCRPDWPSGQSLLPLIDDSFGSFDETKSPVTSVFGTLSVRPTAPDLRHLRYFRYPNGEEQVYDLIADPGETTNLAGTAPMDRLRDELVRNAADLGIDLSGAENPAYGINAMMAVDGSVVLAGGAGDTHYWAYGADTARISAEADGGHNTLWYLGGPNDFVLQMPPHMHELRVATVVARTEGGESREGRTLRIVGHPDSPFRFESSERVSVHVIGSNGDDVMIGQKYGGATFHGQGGDDLLVATSKRPKDRNVFHGGSGNDTLIGGPGRDSLYGGSGDDVIHLRGARGLAVAGPGNDEIRADEGEAEIDAGPGRNVIDLAGGSHRVTLGPGPNRITAGQGAKRFILEHGATVELTGWDKAQRYVLKDWSGPIHQRVLDGGGTMLYAATSCLVVTDCPEGTDLLAQVEGA